MINWKNADENELLLLDSIKFLLKNHQKLLIFLLHPSKPRLNGDPQALLQDASCFSSGEYLLIQIAIDFWDGSGNAKLVDIYSILDRNIYLRPLKVIDRLKWKAINSSSYGRFN